MPVNCVWHRLSVRWVGIVFFLLESASHALRSVLKYTVIARLDPGRQGSYYRGA
jgi:hypothetical protein